MRERDLDKALISFARWLAGLKPSYGHKYYYFEKYRALSEFAKRVAHLRGKKVCPFCGREFKRVSGYITHVLKHKFDVASILG